MRGAKLQAADWLAHGGILIHPALRFGCIGVTALILGFALGLRAVPSTLSISETTQPKGFDRLWAAHETPIPNSREWRVASLDVAYFDPGTEDSNRPLQAAPSTGDRSLLATESVQQRSHVISFDERFKSSFGFSAVRPMDETEVLVYSTLPPSPEAGARAPDRPAAGRTGRAATQLASLSPAGISKKQLSNPDASEDANSPVDDDDHTAIYDISAHKVYLPNGRALEAHSGFGKRLDDPRYVKDKDLGPTPPNVYNLSLREEPFHGVRAIRLLPAGHGNMFGRDGLLAHSYMLGPNGQSNGCVSFSDYPAFLHAYLNGEVNRLVVVDHLDTPPSSKTVAARIVETLKALF